MLIHELVEHTDDLGAAGDVGLVPGHPAAMASHHFHSALGVVVTRDVVDADVRAVACEQLGYPAPDTPAGSL